MDLHDAQIGGRSDFEGSKVTGKLNMESLTTRHLVMNEHAKFAEIDLSVAHIQGVAALANSKFTRPIKMIGIRIDGLLEANDAEFSDVDLQFARIGSKLNICE